MTEKKNGKNRDLLTFTDTIFVVNGEMIENRGEDSYAFSLNNNCGMLGVFDGCGGIGARKYEEYENQTGAYLASRAAAEVVYGWFSEFCSEKTVLSGNTVKPVCDEVARRLKERLCAMAEKTGRTSIKGSLTKSFPTTCSLALFTHENKSLYSAFIWAGDSRGFILTADGLHQVTADDSADGDDALAGIRSDSRLTNMISADGGFVLHNRIITCSQPCVVLTATDGCFGYFSTPMEFEYMLLETMKAASNANEWSKRLKAYIRRFAGDDYTIGIAAFGFNSFRSMQKAFAGRKQEMYGKYISGLRNASEQEKQSLWNEYKKTYCGGV